MIEEEVCGGTADHIHLLTSIDKRQTVADALRVIKTNSSGWIHETFSRMNTFAWQNGYAAFTVSYSNLHEAKRYIDRQEEHHRTIGFKEELRALLKRHDIEFNEQYLWD